MLLVLTSAGCGATPPSGSPFPTALTSTTAPSQLVSPAAESPFYLRAWYSQALPPPATFAWLPLLTIADGTAIDGNVAVPAIYPGPLLIVPTARWISDAAIAAIVDEARHRGLLGGRTDFAGDALIPGSRTAHLHITLDGVSHDLIGNGDGSGCEGVECPAEPGTPEAFTPFWQRLANLEAWLGDELGAPVQYQPERVAALFMAAEEVEPGLDRLVRWPLEEAFSALGIPFAAADPAARCRTYTGGELATVLPVLRDADQATVFEDVLGATRSVVVAALVPGQPSPCEDGR